MHETSPKAVPVTGQLQAVRQGVRSSLLVPGDTREVSLIHLLTGLADRVSRSTSHLLLQTVGYSLEHRGEIHCINIHPSQPFTNTQRTPKIDLRWLTRAKAVQSTFFREAWLLKTASTSSGRNMLLSELLWRSVLC